MAATIADLFEHAVDVVPEREALIVGDTRLTYAELEERANAFAHHLLDAGIGRADHVGLMARNVADHVVAMLAVFKVRAVPININFRYVEAELDHLVHDAGLTAMVHEREYTPTLESVLPRHAVDTAVVIEDGTDHRPRNYAAVSWTDATFGRSTRRDFEARGPDDLYIVYTGGTTGYPKGVMWRQEDVWRTLGGGIDFRTRERLTEYEQSRRAAADPHPLTCMQLGPIMHANGQWGMLLRFFCGHTNVLLPHFDPAEIWRTLERERVNTISLIGDAMARPLIEEYERGDYDARSLRALTSAAAIFSVEVKQRWLDAFPDVAVMDIIGSSETGFTGSGRIEHETLADKGSLVSLGAETVVLDDTDRIMDPDAEIGSVGRMARTGSIPLGYLGDPEKTARTFVWIDGVRYAVPGDWVQIEAGRRLTLLGRGSSCINTGGEKVYPEEVEVALKSHHGVYDALVFALPHPTWGQQVAALLQPRSGTEVDPDDVRRHLRDRVSRYKVPRLLHQVPEIPRHVTGKADYTRARNMLPGPTEQQTLG